ncbi:THO complex subunit 7A [Dorcoceras hygrometricum]|uniref:THO complex subunit 7A n=1 Tax=Dorcoceras hygrometricum TaxID=472368 RepID=A0A2Z7C9G5_9LAMI|nr:THO complex subunit 7A [Dorcoceras hygrometricum]
MLKGRKAPGRGETVATHYAFGPVEDDIIIKHRLLTRTTTTRGEPPLKKLQKKFTSFVLEVEKEADNYGDCERLAKAFLQELNTFEIPLLKSKAVIDANIREKENFNELKEEINRQILQARDDIEDLKRQFEESKIERQHKEECEAIRKLIAVHPPRSETQDIITELEKEIAMLEAENTAGSRTLDLRKKQFALLLHVLLLNTANQDHCGHLNKIAYCVISRVLYHGISYCVNVIPKEEPKVKVYPSTLDNVRNFLPTLHLGVLADVDELQNTIEEEQRSLMEETRTAMYEHRAGMEDATGGTEAMVLD